MVVVAEADKVNDVVVVEDVDLLAVFEADAVRDVVVVEDFDLVAVAEADTVCDVVAVKDFDLVPVLEADSVRDGDVVTDVVRDVLDDRDVDVVTESEAVAVRDVLGVRDAVLLLVGSTDPVIDPDADREKVRDDEAEFGSPWPGHDTVTATHTVTVGVTVGGSTHSPRAIALEKHTVVGPEAATAASAAGDSVNPRALYHSRARRDTRRTNEPRRAEHKRLHVVVRERPTRSDSIAV